MVRPFIVALLFLVSAAFGQNKFYNYYSNGLEYMEKQDWLRAIEEFKSAASLEFEDAPRKRTYGTHFIEYFPHREIGIAHFMLGEKEAAKKELELSIAYRLSDRSEMYYKKITNGEMPPQRTVAAVVPVEKKEPVQKTPDPVASPKSAVPAEQKKQNPVPSAPANPTVQTQSTPSIIVVTKKYDPSASTQVGSRLAVAVLPFEADKNAAMYKEEITNEMITQLVNLRRFKVIERSAMDKIVSEQKLQASGVVDDKSAVKLGKIAGADALVIGHISVINGIVKVSARLVDVETAETIIAQDATGEAGKQESVDNAVTNVATLLYNELPIIEGDIIKVDADEFYIDIGGMSGVKKGTKCVVFRQGESIKHPISGEILGRKVTRLGEVIVLQVQEKFATVKPLETEQDIQVNDKVIIK